MAPSIVKTPEYFEPFIKINSNFTIVSRKKLFDEKLKLLFGFGIVVSYQKDITANLSVHL